MSEKPPMTPRQLDKEVGLKPDKYLKQPPAEKQGFNYEKSGVVPPLSKEQLEEYNKKRASEKRE